MCREEKVLDAFSVKPGKPRTKVCETCIEKQKARTFKRKCVECGGKITSKSPRASVCAKCQPARAKKKAPEWAKAYRERKKKNPP